MRSVRISLSLVHCEIVILLLIPRWHRRDGVMDQLERFLVIASSGEVTQALDFRALDTLGPEARTSYLGNALQKVLKQYTNAAASFTSEILSFISRFAIQVCMRFCASFVEIYHVDTFGEEMS